MQQATYDNAVALYDYLRDVGIANELDAIEYANTGYDVFSRWYGFEETYCVVRHDEVLVVGYQSNHRISPRDLDWLQQVAHTLSELLDGVEE